MKASEARCRAWIGALVGACLLGCQTPAPKPQRGDVAPFILEQASRYGGQPRAGTGYSRIEAVWWLVADKHQADIRIAGDRFTEIATLLRQAFGEPRTPVARKDNGRWSGGYWRQDIGVAIQFSGDTESCRVVCIHPRP